jgi:aspartyl-tRNA(Asn)/glutamyl-tRNA(Gln) amidotransferase subunit A
MDLPISIEELRKRLLKKEFTIPEITDIYLARINKYNPELNAFITVSEERAYADAKRAQRILDTKGETAFEEYPLLGVAICYKDIYLTKSIRTTAASRVLESYIPTYNATVVDRLTKGGAVMIGKTNCDAWAHGASGENSDFGPTKNPWDTKLVPGGSSSGSAVSCAADFSLVAMGTDTGGSIRQPASFCGVVGFKPTYGVVSRYGVIAMASSLDCMGHFTHTIEDTKKVFEVTRGQDGHDATVVKYPKVQISNRKRIGIPKEYFSEGLDRQIERNVLEAIGVYKKLGYEIVDVSLPYTKYGVSVYYIVQPAEVSSNLSRFDGVRYGNNRETFGAEAKRRIMLGTYVLSAGYYDAYYLQAMKVRTKLIQDFDMAFEKVDVILAPVSPELPFPIGEKTSDPLKMYLADIYTVSANLAGIPGISVPCGFTTSGCPTAFQLMGPRFSEEVLFDTAKVYENETKSYKTKPKL